MVSVVSAYPCFGLQLIQTNLILSYFPVKLGRRLCDVSAGVRETSFVFQCVSVCGSTLQVRVVARYSVETGLISRIVS